MKHIIAFAFAFINLLVKSSSEELNGVIFKKVQGDNFNVGNLPNWWIKHCYLKKNSASGDDTSCGYLDNRKFSGVCSTVIKTIIEKFYCKFEIFDLQLKGKFHKHQFKSVNVEAPMVFFTFYPVCSSTAMG